MKINLLQIANFAIFPARAHFFDTFFKYRFNTLISSVLQTPHLPFPTVMVFPHTGTLPTLRTAIIAFYYIGIKNIIIFAPKIPKGKHIIIN